MNKFLLGNIICASTAVTATVVAPAAVAASEAAHHEITLNDYSWDEIKQISESGKASEMFKIGDEKDVLVNGLIHKVRIIDFDHDIIWDGHGKKAGITFEFANVISHIGYKGQNRPNGTPWDGIYGVEDSGDNSCYPDSALNKFLNNASEPVDTIINILPEDLVNVIKDVQKQVGTDRGKKTGTFTLEIFKTKLFCLSDDELYKKPSQEFSVHNEGTLYKYYDIHSDENETKKTAPGSDVNWDYWLRSPTLLDDDKYTFVFAEGTTDGDQYASEVWGYNFGVAPGFCI